MGANTEADVGVGVIESAIDSSLSVSLRNGFTTLPPVLELSVTRGGRDDDDMVPGTPNDCSVGLDAVCLVVTA